MNVDADELLAMVRREYPVQYQLAQQKVIINKQHERIQQLQAENAALRESAGNATGAAVSDTDTDNYEPSTRSFLRPATPPAER